MRESTGFSGSADLKSVLFREPHNSYPSPYLYLRVPSCPSWILLFFSVFLCVLCGEPASARPHVIVVLCEALTFEDIHNEACPALADFAEKSAVGLMRCPVSGPLTPAAAALTLATGRIADSGPDDAQAANDWELVPGDSGSARNVFMRRIGPLDPHWDTKITEPQQSVKHLGLAGLVRRGLNDGRIGAILAQANPPVRAAVYGNADTDTRNRSGALLTLSASGIGAGVPALLRYYQNAPYGLVDDPLALLQYVEESEANFIVVQLGDLARLDRVQAGFSREDKKGFRSEALRRLNIFLYGLTAGLKEQGKQADILLLAPRPPADPRHFGAWNRLAPILASGPDFPPGLLTSDTTGLSGVVSNIDLAPTLLGLFHAPLPSGTEGKPLHTVEQNLSGPQRVAALARRDFVAAFNARAQTDILLPLALGFFLLQTIGWLRRRKTSAPPPRTPWLPVALLNLPPALLLAPLLIPPTLLEYGLRITAWLIGLTVVSLLLARRFTLNPILLAAGIGFLLLLADTLTGSALQQSALFGTASVTPWRGIYPALLIGYALIGCAMLYYRKAKSPPVPPQSEQAGQTAK